MAETWQGSFISSPTTGDPEGPAPYFRYEFPVAGGLRSAVLLVSALGIVAPYLNGHPIGEEVLAPGWTSYRHRLGVRAHDVTALLTEGINAVGAIVGEGWAAGRLGWEEKRHFWTDRPALFLELRLDYGDHVDVVGSGPHFSTGTGGVRAHSIYDGETFDAGLEPDGWARPGFDDSAWARAAIFDWDTDALTVDAAPSILRIEELAPLSIEQLADGRHLVDFGQNFSGWVRLRVIGNRGDAITLRHAETLTPDGALLPDTNRTAKATDRYVLRGGGEETWEPRFTFHGFRYVEIDGWPGEVSQDAIRGIVVHSEMRRTGWFETSEPLVNRLHDNALWSMRGNFVGVPTDCPQRDERLGWTGDLNAFAPTATFLYGVRDVLGSWLTDLAAEQQEKGYVPWVVPDVLPTPSSPTAIWSDVVISLPWTLYQEYGDVNILRDSYQPMAMFMRQVEGMLDAEDLWSSGFQFGDWLDPDAPYEHPSAGKTDRHLVAGAYLCRTTREIAETAKLVGGDSDAAHFEDLHRRVLSAFRSEYITPSGRITGETATAYALAICFDIFEERQRSKAGSRLAQLVADAGFHISTGFAGTPYVTEALSSTGHLDEAYLLLTEKTSPSFLYPVTMGATTTWERWDSVLPDGNLNESGMTSLNHYALGAVVAWLYTTVGGLRRLAPGWRRVRIAPQPGGGLTSARTVHDTVHGRIEVAWRIDGETVSLDVVIPQGVDAEVLLPLHPDADLIQLTTGAHSWNYRVPRLGTRHAFTMDSPLGQIGAERTLWYQVFAVLSKHLPGMTLDPNGPEVSQLSLSTLLGHIPSIPPAAEDELRAVLAGEI